MSPETGAGPPTHRPLAMASEEEAKYAIAGLQAVPGRLIRRLHRYTSRPDGRAAVVLLLAGAGYTVWMRHGTMGAAEPVALSGRKMLVVLPFENRGPPPDDYFADGLTEAIGMRLGGIRSLGVIASQSRMQYKGTSKSLAQIGRELGVQYVLQGSVRWEKAAGASRVRVSPTLLRVSDGRQLWAAQYDTVPAGMFALQTSLATKIAGALDVTLLNSERRLLEAPTANPEAYDAFLRGIQAMEDGSGPGWNAEGGGAVRARGGPRLDFVPAYAYLSIAHVVMYLSYLDRDVDQLRRGKAALDRVMQLDPECDSGSCCALGFYQLFVLKDYDGALHEFIRARRVRPSDHNLPGLIAHVYDVRGSGKRPGLPARGRAAQSARSWGGRRAWAALRCAASVRCRELLSGPGAGRDAASGQRPSGQGPCVPQSHWRPEGSPAFPPDVSENISPTGTEDVIVSLQDIVLLLSDEQQTRLLQLTPAALDGDTAALALAKALVHRQRNQRSLARASFDSARVVLQDKVRRHPNEDPFYHAMLGLALAGLERPEDAVQ